MAGLLTRIGRAIANRPAPEGPPERRDAGGFGVGVGIGFGGITMPGNTFMGAFAAENVAAITASVHLIASTIGGLPATVYRRTDTGRVAAPDHPVSRLIRQPNNRQTFPDFLEWLTSQILLFGNGLSLIEVDGNGQPTELLPIPWPHVIPILIPDTRRLAFDVLQIGPWGGTGLPRRVLDTEMLHVRDRSDDGYLGRSRLSRSPGTIEAALAIQEYATAVWRNGANPSAVIKHSGRLNAEARHFLRQQFDAQFSGAANARKTLVLDEGMDYSPTSNTPEASECLDSRRFSEEQCARIVGCPPQLIGILDHSSFTSSSTAGSWLGQFTLAPIVRKIEAEFGRTVFADPGGPFHLELDMSGLMRGDSTAQQASNVANVAAGVMTVDEARFDLGLNPLPAAAAPLDGALPGVDPP